MSFSLSFKFETNIALANSKDPGLGMHCLFMPLKYNRTIGINWNLSRVTKTKIVFNVKIYKCMNEIQFMN